MAYYDGNYDKHKSRNLRRGPRKPWRAFYYANNKRIFLGQFATKELAEQREYTEKIRRQRELLEIFPEEIKLHRQQRLI